MKRLGFTTRVYSLTVYVLAVFCCSTALSSRLYAEEGSNTENSDIENSDAIEVVVSANRAKTHRKKVASSVTVIHEEDIRTSQLSSLPEILRGVPGLDVVRSGGRGGNVAVFMRGANSEHTLVRIDGIEANNPSSNSRLFNFADIPLENIERIEILRGPQSTLYGSDAIGGVISITTKSGSGDPTLNLSSEAGSFETYIQKAQSSGNIDGILDYSFSYTRQDTDGISAASERAGNTEDDGYTNNSFSTRIGYAPFENGKFNAIFRYINGKSDIDNVGGAFGDDPNRRLDNEQIFFRSTIDVELFAGRVKQTYGAAISDHTLHDDNDPDIDHPGEIQRSLFDGSLTKWDLQNTVEVLNELQIIAGLETEEEKASYSFSSDGPFGPFTDNLFLQKARTNGYYAQGLIQLGKHFDTSAGIRVDDHSQFGSETTWKIAPVVNIDSTSTRITGTYGTGFKSPSLYQLFSAFGNRELLAEQSKGFDFGFEQALFDDVLTFGATYFDNKIEDLITFDTATFIFENINEADIQGVESFIRIEPCESVDMSVDYTFTDAEDDATGQMLLRRAKHKIGSTANIHLLGDKLHFSLRAVHTGSRYDNDFSTFPATRTKLGSYTLVDLRGSYQATDWLEVFARVENLFDKDYEEVLGFSSPGIGGYGGVRISLS